MKDGGEEVEGALNPAKEWVPERVEAKTDVVRCKSFYSSFSVHTLSLSPFDGFLTALISCLEIEMESRYLSTIHLRSSSGRG